MRPVKLEMQGLRSYRKKSIIDFSEVGLFAIVGDTGSCKSSILEAITFALYNATTWGKGPKQLISDSGGVNTMTVSLEFRAEGELWRVTRSSSKSSSPPTVHQLECLSDPGFTRLESEAEVTAEIKRLVGLDYTAFKSAVLLPQGRFQTLLQAPEGQRNSILKGVFGLQRISKIRERAKATAGEKWSKLDHLRDKQTALAPDPERELEKCAQLNDRYEQREAALGNAVQACREVEENRREIVRLLKERQRQLERLRGDVAVVEELGDLSGLLQVEQELNQRRADLEGQQKGLEAEREHGARLLGAHREAGEDESSLEIASLELKNLAEEHPSVKKGLKANVGRRQEIEEKKEELEKREAAHKKAAAEAKRARTVRDDTRTLPKYPKDSARLGSKGVKATRPRTAEEVRGSHFRTEAGRENTRRHESAPRCPARRAYGSPPSDGA